MHLNWNENQDGTDQLDISDGMFCARIVQDPDDQNRHMAHVFYQGRAVSTTLLKGRTPQERRIEAVQAARKYMGLGVACLRQIDNSLAGLEERLKSEHRNRIPDLVYVNSKGVADNRTGKPITAPALLLDRENIRVHDYGPLDYLERQYGPLLEAITANRFLIVRVKTAGLDPATICRNINDLNADQDVFRAFLDRLDRNSGPNAVCLGDDAPGT